MGDCSRWSLLSVAIVKHPRVRLVGPEYSTVIVARSRASMWTALTDRDRITAPRGIIPPVNRFFQWIGLKQKLHQGTQAPPLVSAGDIWWASIGENVGSEINGKSRLFSRPVIIFKKLAHGFYFVIPTTTKSKVGSWFVPFRQAYRRMVASLHQAWRLYK